MFDQPAKRKSRGSDEAEKPFWISFADLMTALMALFLVVMVVALTQVRTDINTDEVVESQRNTDIDRFMQQIQALEQQGFAGITVDISNRTVSFNENAYFEQNSDRLNLKSAEFARAFTKQLISLINQQNPDWLGKVVVEGFTDRTGDYLLNLDLSLRRSQRLLCVLLDERNPSEIEFSRAEVELIKQTFFVGGYSSNLQKNSDAESRRIEFRMEFKPLQKHLVEGAVKAVPVEPKTSASLTVGPTGQCRI